MKDSVLTWLKPIIGVLIVSFIFFSCKKDEKEKPKMQIDTSSLSLTSEDNEAQFVITNLGEKTLEWEIANKPRWIDVTDLLGKLEPGSKIITVTADLTTEFGVYEGTILITSNGGKDSINVTFDHESLAPDPEEIGIYPGVGVDDIELFENYATLKAECGEPDETGAEAIFDDNDKFLYYLGWVDYDSMGLAFYFDCDVNDFVSNADEFFLIEIDESYPRKTNKGIGTSSTLQNVINVYGTPPAADRVEYADEGYGIYYYMSLGISFIYDLNTEKLIVIWVHRQQKKSSSALIRYLGANFRQ